MSWQRLILAGLIGFTALSVTDFLQTFALVEASDGRIVEGNPVAAEWLDRWGWTGLAVFKAGAVAVVLGVIYVLARHRPPAGAMVAAIGCLALAVVTTRSDHLLANLPPAHEEDEFLAGQPLPRPRAEASVRRLPRDPADAAVPLS
jgi:uncharacterized membrane protein